MFTGNSVSTGVGVVCLIVAFLMNGLPRPRWWPGKIPWGVPWLNLALVGAGTVAVLGSKPGRWLQEAATAVDRQVSPYVVSWIGVGVMFALAIAAAVALIVHLLRSADTGPDGKTLALAVATGFLSSAIPGTVGVFVVAVYGFFAFVAGGFIGWAFGL